MTSWKRFGPLFFTAVLFSAGIWAQNGPIQGHPEITPVPPLEQEQYNKKPPGQSGFVTLVGSVSSIMSEDKTGIVSAVLVVEDKYEKTEYVLVLDDAGTEMVRVTNGQRVEVSGFVTHQDGQTLLKVLSFEFVPEQVSTDTAGDFARGGLARP